MQQVRDSALLQVVRGGSCDAIVRGGFHVLPASLGAVLSGSSTRALMCAVLLRLGWVVLRSVPQVATRDHQSVGLTGIGVEVHTKI